MTDTHQHNYSDTEKPKGGTKSAPVAYADLSDPLWRRGYAVAWARTSSSGTFAGRRNELIADIGRDLIALMKDVDFQGKPRCALSRGIHQ